jgi:hypothetical protein
MKTTFYFYQDPGHGWLKVPLSLIAELGIADKISSYSYMSLDHAYLEEDCDMGKFDQAMREQGKEYNLVNKLSNKQAHIRSYANYSAAFVTKQIQNGSRVKLTNGVEATVRFIAGKRKIYLEYNGGAYLATKQNIIEYVSEVLA